MTLSELINCVSETQIINLMGDGIAGSLTAESETLAAALNEEVLSMKVTDIEAEDSVVKVWVEVSG